MKCIISGGGSSDSQWTNGVGDGFSIDDSNGDGSDRGVVAGEIGGVAAAVVVMMVTVTVGSDDECSKFGDYEGAYTFALMLMRRARSKW